MISTPATAPLIDNAALLSRLIAIERAINLLVARASADELLTTAEVCALLKIHANTWANWVRKYPKPPTALGSPSCPKYRRSSVLRFASNIRKYSKSRSEENKNGDYAK